MVNFLMISGIILLLLAFPASIIVTIVFAIKKKKILIPAICIPASFFVGIVVIMIGGFLYGQTDEYKRSIKEQENQVSVETESQYEEVKEENKENTQPTKTELSEEEYKAKCKKVFYDEIFFGETDLEGEYVKLNLFLSEAYYFSKDDMLSSTFKEYDNKYNLKRDFYKCCVLREGTNSYVGQQINMWFSEDYSLNPNDYDTGQKVTVYAKVIAWSNNTWNGYNSVTIIPKYIESK